MDTKYLIVSEQVQNKEGSMVSISTYKLIGDPLTKSLPPKLFKEHITSIEVIE